MKYYLLTFLSILANHGICCTCGPERTVTDEFNGSDKIVIGTILSQEEILQTDSMEFNRLLKKGVNETQARRFTTGGYRQFTLVLSESAYKGTFATDTVLIRTGLTSGSCGFSFQIGKKYVVYGYNRDPIPNESNDKSEQFWTNNCTRTNLFNDREQKALTRIVKRNEKKSP